MIEEANDTSPYLSNFVSKSNWTHATLVKINLEKVSGRHFENG
jgi:hypothetical protein